MPKDEKKMLCAGCYCNDYNHGLGGATECFSFKKSEICKKKEVHINDVPPWKRQRVFKTLSCYHKPKFVYVGANQEY